MSPLDLAWRELAEAEVEHDLEHARRALDYIRRLQQRSADAVGTADRWHDDLTMDR